MRITAILNKDGGALKTENLQRFSGLLRAAFEDAGHAIEVRIIAGDDLIAALEAAENDPAIDAIVAGGGDGTISAAAGYIGPRLLKRFTSEPVNQVTAGMFGGTFFYCLGGMSVSVMKSSSLLLLLLPTLSSSLP